MAIIYSYPLNDDIKPLDELVGTTEKNINGQLKTVTRNFLLQDLAEFFIVDGGIQKTIILTTEGDEGPSTLDQVTGILNIPQYAGLQNLQQVTDLGNVTSNSMRVELANNYSQINVSNIGTENTTLSTYAYLRNNGSISIKSGAVESNIKNTSVTNSGVILEFPNKVSGSYTIATTSDVIAQNLQQVTDVGATTTNSITANSFIKSGGTGTNALLDNGLTIALLSIVGKTNLSTSQTATNFTINSDTGTDALVPLGNGALAGATLNNYTTVEKNKLAAITGTNTGDQNLQQVTNLGASTSNPINVSVTGASVGITGGSPNGKGINGYSDTGIGVDGFSTTGVGTRGFSEEGVGGEFDAGGSGNIVNFKALGILKAFVNPIGEFTAQKLIKDGGNSAELLAANGDTITAGTNITISGGTISSTGGAGGSSSVNFYLNGSIASNVAGYQQIGATAVIGTGTDFSLVGNGTIAQFLTNVGSPNRLEIPSGAWNFELWLQSSVNNSGTNVHIELYKYDGAFTLIATGVLNPINLQTNTTTNLYVTNVAIPQTTLLATDRLAIRVIASNAVGLHSVTLHTEDSNICEVITNFVGGVTAINGITQPSQTLATGTTGTDFAINSSGSTHTFNLPSASATNRGALSSTDWTTFNNKQPSSTNLTSLAGLTYSTPAFVKMTAAGTFTLDTSGGAITLSAIGTAPNAFGATITGSVLNLQPASGSFGGVITTGNQTFAGVKTFNTSPLAPTPTIGTNNTTVATTAFVNASIPGSIAYNILIGDGTGMGNIDTQATGTSGGNSYPQNGRNVMINNGATAITITANTLLTATDFIASYTKVGTANITFLFTGTGRVEIMPNGVALSGSEGSTALLTKNGNIFYLLINNLI